MFVCNSHRLDVVQLGLIWPVISKENRPITVPTDLLKCNMKTCLSVVLEAGFYCNSSG